MSRVEDYVPNLGEFGDQYFTEDDELDQMFGKYFQRTRGDERTVAEGTAFLDRPSQVQGFSELSNAKRKARKYTRRNVLSEEEQSELVKQIQLNAQNIKDLEDSKRRERSERGYQKRLADQTKRAEQRELDDFRASVNVNQLFLPAIIERYVSDPDIKRQLGQIELYCNHDILAMYNYDIDTFNQNAKLCCQGEIGENYMFDGFHKTFSRSPGFQLLTAVDSISQEIVGFLTAQRGECELSPEVWSVNLICTAAKHGTSKRSSVGRPVKTLSQGVPTISGTLLLGAMLYSLKILNRPFAILEVAGGYMNGPGFIAYSKLGFVKNLSLFNNGNVIYDEFKPKCFTDPTNLPMYVSLDTFLPADILDIVTSRRKIVLSNSQDDTGFFERYLEKDFYDPQREGTSANMTYQTILCLKPAQRRVVERSYMSDEDKRLVRRAAQNLVSRLPNVDIIPDRIEMPVQTYTIERGRNSGGMRKTRKRKRIRKRTRNAI
jgi:hypothetical protein